LSSNKCFSEAFPLVFAATDLPNETEEY
jgi:formiminotetrahydrofolate cyclodeaminase